MISDFKNNGSSRDYEADICIVGSGAASLSMAREFLGTSLQVLVLESGGLSAEAEIQRLNQVETVGLQFPSGMTGRAREFGGTTTLWGGGLMPLEVSDFEVQDWIPHSGWPLSRTDLEPYYQRANGVVNLPAEWKSEHMGMFAPAGFDSSLLDWNYTFARSSSSLSASQPHNLKTGYIKRLRDAPNIHVLLHANATDAVLSDRARVDGINFRDLSGRKGYVRARSVVLAMGGIEIPRFLLLTGETNGCRHTLFKNVGRFFQARPKFDAGIVTEKNPEINFRDMFGRRRSGNYSFRTKLTLSEKIRKVEKLPKCDAGLDFEFLASSGIKAAKELLERPKSIGAFTSSMMRATKGMGEVLQYGVPKLIFGRYPTGFPSIIRVECRPEQLPDPDSRILLSGELDELGLPKAEIHWQIRELERRAVCRTIELVDSEFRRLKWGRVTRSEWLDDENSDWRDQVTEGNHHCGTTRMSEDPQYGVVDKNCQVHGIENLYISSSSVFPTSGTATPTYTIMALSIRLADHLKKRLGFKPAEVVDVETLVV